MFVFIRCLNQTTNVNVRVIALHLQFIELAERCYFASVHFPVQSMLHHIHFFAVTRLSITLFLNEECVSQIEKVVLSSRESACSERSSRKSDCN